MAKKVLIVDDSATVRQQVAAALAPTGFEVTEASDGVAGLDALARDPAIAVVICDVNMPRMDGLAMLEAVKREPRHAALPVVMLTTEGQPALMKRAKEAGAKGWIVKPFNATLLAAAVQKLAS
jgi:two-component system, chemotaxis family, chemotaxis protein CheY